MSSLVPRPVCVWHGNEASAFQLCYWLWWGYYTRSAWLLPVSTPWPSVLYSNTPSSMRSGNVTVLSPHCIQVPRWSGCVERPDWRVLGVHGAQGQGDHVPRLDPAPLRLYRQSARESIPSCFIATVKKQPMRILSTQDQKCCH